MKKKFLLLGLITSISINLLACASNETPSEEASSSETAQEELNTVLDNQEDIDVIEEEAEDNDDAVVIEVKENGSKSDEYIESFEKDNRCGTNYKKTGDAEVAEFDTWQEGYKTLIEELAEESSDIRFSLVNINDDDIPELAYMLEDGKMLIATFADETVNIFGSQLDSMSYIEKDNALFASELVGATYGDYVLAIDEDGFWIQIAYGARRPIDEWAEDSFDENGNPIISYWAVNEQELSGQSDYDDELNKYFSANDFESISATMSADEILSQIEEF